MNLIKMTIKGMIYFLLFSYGMFCVFGGWLFLESPYNFLSIMPCFLFVFYTFGKVYSSEL